MDEKEKMEGEKGYRGITLLDKAKGEHTRFKEEIVVFEKSLDYIYTVEAYNNIRKVIDFFEENITIHFDFEEKKIFSIAMVIGELEIKQIVRDLQQQHIFILGLYDKIKNIIFKYGFSFQDEKIKDEFIRLSKDLIGAILIHARKEDDELFPYLIAKGVDLKYTE